MQEYQQFNMKRALQDYIVLITHDKFSSITKLIVAINNFNINLDDQVGLV